MAKVRHGLSKGRMPILILGASALTWHVVAAADVSSGAIRVYDPNVPLRYPRLRLLERQFYGEEVFTNDQVRGKPIGVFIDEEDRMNELEKAMFDYYRGLCDEALKAIPNES